MRLLSGLTFMRGLGLPLWRVFDVEPPAQWWQRVLVVVAMVCGFAVVALLLLEPVGMLVFGSLLGCLVGLVAPPVRGDWVLEPALGLGLVGALMVSGFAYRVLQSRESSMVL
ncbi:hypothetical protein ACU686_12835 [Yinghuangia aomiensis]